MSRYHIRVIRAVSGFDYGDRLYTLPTQYTDINKAHDELMTRKANYPIFEGVVEVCSSDFIGRVCLCDIG